MNNKALTFFIAFSLTLGLVYFVHAVKIYSLVGNDIKRIIDLDREE